MQILNRILSLIKMVITDMFCFLTIVDNILISDTPSQSISHKPASKILTREIGSCYNCRHFPGCFPPPWHVQLIPISLNIHYPSVLRERVCLLVWILDICFCSEHDFYYCGRFKDYTFSVSFKTFNHHCQEYL